MPFGIPNDDFYSNADEIQRRLDANAEAIKCLKAGLSAQGNKCPKHGIYLNWLEICPSCAAETQERLDRGVPTPKTFPEKSY